MEEKNLHLKFHGKILDQLGFQTYQSPVASLAELVSNSWDADALKVEITLPNTNDPGEEIIIKDNGIGMTFQECEEHYLNVGWNRREDQPTARTPSGRPVLGRKGIGKFAGFGIANKIQVITISKTTGEKTEFEMDLEQLRGNTYIADGKEIETKYEAPNNDRIKDHGTEIKLKSLNLSKMIPKTQFPISMSRRFLLHRTTNNFQVFVDGNLIPEKEDISQIEFVFPRDYEKTELPENVTIEDGWGIETLSDGHQIKWKIFFYQDTISEDELQGITVFANGKLAQKPFFFNISGGLGGQAGQSYMSGQIIANYVDELDIDPIAAERQRINWEIPQTLPLLEWGQQRVKKLLVMWHDRRGEKRRQELEKKVSAFSDRLEKLEKHEAKTVKKVLTKLGGIPTLTKKQYEETAEAVLNSWEEGRLRDLMTSIAESDNLSEPEFLNLLMETEIISALNVAEAIKTKLMAIARLKERIKKKELEDAVRNHLAKNPWIISPKWDTFKVETSVVGMIRDMADKSGLAKDEYKGRVDLVLSSAEHLLVIEFMRPGLTLDWDHINRCEKYVTKIKVAVKANSLKDFRKVTGYIIADNVEKNPDIVEKIEQLRGTDIYVTDWKGLLDEAKSAWNEYLRILVKRGKGDARLQSLLDDT